MSVRTTKEVKLVSVQKNMEDGYPSFVADKVARRAILRPIGVNAILGNVCTALAAPMQEMKELDVLRTLKLPCEVIIQVEGKGQEAGEEDTVQFNYVCRRSNGYFVHSTVDQFSGESSPVILRLDDEQVIKGLKEVLSGMKVGGWINEVHEERFVSFGYEIPTAATSNYFTFFVCISLGCIQTLTQTYGCRMIIE
ncbi:peptidyl-prolyl cis-trans isomerase FKBP16-1, chloroplastic isoform X2 [Salvia miltiorrhiza]|uniref:peptidyl-prolyl cis-trans isomerase FKBP16-1, chloroplastic isoform X2 n=1 Tax=Salvia miltiorrhiza TaxID=226208 RepID=UPI0025AB8412|nr:peptidyl-prolyl cis-trans isomerase FKBP16-1, chloroplastic isoform X2 [Salvia miltiorrhiza]